MSDKLDDLLVELIESHADRVRVLELFAELRAENERLRAALEQLVQIGPASTMGDFKRAQARALEVLNSEAGAQG